MAHPVHTFELFLFFPLFLEDPFAFLINRLLIMGRLVTLLIKEFVSDTAAFVAPSGLFGLLLTLSQTGVDFGTAEEGRRVLIRTTSFGEVGEAVVQSQ